jgi:quercetin dioxygenase-like cupin family protein
MAKPKLPPSKPPAVFIYDQVDWDHRMRAKSAASPPKELIDQARRSGARRKKIIQGESGFFMNRSVLPAGFRVPPHHHTHDEILVILKGGCQFDDEVATLGADDSIVIHANYRYGFTCGPEGMEFLTIRMGEAGVTL